MGGICSSGGSGVKPNIEEEENEAEELTVGSYFGESTLIKGVPQPRTVRALGRTSLLVLSSEVLQRLCGEDVLKNASVNTPAESSEPKANIVDDDQIRRPANQKKRGSISAGSIEVKKDWVAPVYEHTPEENQRLNEYFAKTTLLSKLDGQRKDTLIGAFQKKEFANGVEIITQGAEGDFYYILDVGSADVFVSKDGKCAQIVIGRPALVRVGIARERQANAVNHNLDQDEAPPQNSNTCRTHLQCRPRRGWRLPPPSSFPLFHRLFWRTLPVVGTYFKASTRGAGSLC